MTHVVVDSLGDDYPTFPQFQQMLRDYERDLAAADADVERRQAIASAGIPDWSITPAPTKASPFVAVTTRGFPYVEYKRPNPSGVASRVAYLQKEIARLEELKRRQPP